MIKNAGGEQVKDSFKHVSLECSWLEFESKEMHQLLSTLQF
jgi:hypothetical protein